MIITILLSYFSIMASAVPARPNVLPSLLSQGGATQATNQKPDAQTPAPLSPEVEQPPQHVAGPQLLPLMQHYTWPPLGGSPVIIHPQPSVHGSQPLPQQPLMFTPHWYFPLFSSPHSNQLFSPHGSPMILAPPRQQTPADQPQSSKVLPAETPNGAAPSAPQPIQQQQNPLIVYLLQQPMNVALGSLSSEELEMAAKLGQLGVYLPSVLTNPSAGVAQPVDQAAGLTNPEQQGIGPTVGTSSAGVPQTQGPASSGPQPNTNGLPVGLEKPTQETVTVQKTKLQPTQGNLV
ncbi:synapsin-1-like [Chelmon rostratus]|uniref:synapsin-1-like n=1 Tax=Chelmon rostratus TaxID=109905 RepID=UPI001BEB7C00|nr:synapsin-1-like [Chelmon rostratus]